MDASAFLPLGLSFAACFAAASSGGVFRPGAWYAALVKPAWTPPNWAFPLVWAALYTAMAVAAFLVWRRAGMEAAPALAVFGVHLAFNAAWSWLFFGLRRLDLAMAEVCALWLSIAVVIALFAQIAPLAAVLMTPYLAWVGLAAFLNLRLLQLNGPRGEGGGAPALDRERPGA